MGKFRGTAARLFKEPLEIVDGHIVVPEDPGLGLEINERILRHRV